MLAERGNAEDLPLPESVQGIIAARLDSLPVEEKSLLQSAAVMGKVFWLGALAQAGNGDRRVAEIHLHALERKDFVQRARRSSVAGEAEYSFLHVLVRDVAYGQMPRGRRAEQHRLAAEWVAALDRTEDHAEMVAHHYGNTIELQRAAGQPLDPALIERALTSLRDAGDRAYSLNAYPGAATFYQSALELAAGDSAEHAHLLFKLGRARFIGGVADADLLAAAADELVRCGDPEAAAEAMAELADVYWFRGDTDMSAERLRSARHLLDGRAPSRAKASVLAHISARALISGESEEAIRVGRETQAMSEQLRLDEFRSIALVITGSAKVDSGDPAGVADLEQGVAIALETNAPVTICRGYGNLSGSLVLLGQLERGFAVMEQAASTVSRFGLVGEAPWVRGEHVVLHHCLGRWQDALVAADKFLAEVEAGSPHYLAAACYHTRAEIRLSRDDVSGALADAHHAIELARAIKDPQMLLPTLASCAHVLRVSGETERASALVDEFLAEREARRSIGTGIVAIHVLAWTLVALGRTDEMIDVLPTSDVPWVQAAAAFSAGDLRRAADICAQMGAVTEEAYDRLCLAEALMTQGRRAEAEAELERALAFYRSVGATRYVREAERMENCQVDD